MTAQTDALLLSAEMSHVVDLGINLLRVLDPDLVAIFLKRRGVRFPVVVRVLAEPERRRRTNRNY